MSGRGGAAQRHQTPGGEEMFSQKHTFHKESAIQGAFLKTFSRDSSEV